MRHLPFLIFSLVAAFDVAAGPKSVYAPHGEEQFTGRAIDRNTGEPIPGVWVIAAYVLGEGGFHASPHCTIAESVRSNERGEYILPFYEGKPPQFLEAFGHRYVPTTAPRRVNRDTRDRWIVEIFEVAGDGKLRIAGQEGPFASQVEAGRASRLLQDVWLEKFTGTDDEWVRKLASISSPGYLCPPKLRQGDDAWEEALLAEAELASDSPAKQSVVQRLRKRIENSKSFKAR
jgi:hypothetical protein